MNHRDTEFTEKRRGRVTLCSLCLCGLIVVPSCLGADKAPVTYNDGVTAYRSNDFTSAATTFEQATASRDRALQQRSYYNLGNTRYRMGEADQTHAIQQWEGALKSYESALALDPKDQDAGFNRDLVKKKIEELRKQQEQQQQNQQNGQNQKQDQQQQQKQDQQPQKDNQQQQEQPKQGDQQQQQDQQQPKPEQGKEQSQQPPQHQPSDNLDKQQATALLDNLREDERNWNFFPEAQMKDLKDAGEPAKDW